MQTTFKYCSPFCSSCTGLPLWFLPLSSLLEDSILHKQQLKKFKDIHKNVIGKREYFRFIPNFLRSEYVLFSHLADAYIQRELQWTTFFEQLRLTGFAQTSNSGNLDYFVAEVLPLLDMLPLLQLLLCGNHVQWWRFCRACARFYLLCI